jgi:beta-1,4-mannosyltransferase
VFTAESPRISVLIIVKDEPEIEKTLELLHDQCKNANAECIVVDASEHRLDSIKVKYPWVNWIDYNQPASKIITIPHQRNIAVAAANSSILLFCDAGGTPSKNWVRDLSTPLLNGKQHLVGGPILYSNTFASTTGENLQNDGEILKVSTTANIGFTRSSFDLVEGFNESLSYGSDADFIWKLTAQGIKHICVSSAVMGLDGGYRRRELKRNWLYGKAIVTLLRLHPNKRREKFKSNPELWVYPLLLMMWVGAVMLILNNLLFILLPLGATCILIFKNIREQHPFRIIFRHYIYGAGTVYQIVAQRWNQRKLFPVLLFPSGNDRYTRELKKAINQNQDIAQHFPSIGPSATLGILLLPLFSLILRIRGARIVHIQWLYSFKLHWVQGKISKTFIQYWFYLWVISLKICRVKIVYTVHNILPHEVIFKNDKKLFKYLEDSADFLILLNERSFKSYSRFYSGKTMSLIPEGPVVMPTTQKRMEHRSHLKVVESKKLIVLTGNLRPYKGLSSLLEGASVLPNTLAIRVAGFADRRFEEELQLSLSGLKAQNIDIDIAFGRLTDDDFGAYLNSADFFCVPFKDINNSESINSALCAGLPVIVPIIDSLDWVPKGARIDIPYDFEGNFDFKELFQSLTKLGEEERNSMHKAALDWASSLSWKHAARQHVNIYKELNGNDD